MDFGWQELLIILAIVVLLFGATRLPMLGKSIGQSIRGFRSGLKGDDEAPKKLEEGGSADNEPADRESDEAAEQK